MEMAYFIHNLDIINKPSNSFVVHVKLLHGKQYWNLSNVVSYSVVYV